MRTGAFRGPGKTHTKRSLQKIAFAGDTQNTQSGHQDANRAHGSLSGSWENSHKSFSPKNRICRRHTKHAVRNFLIAQCAREPFGVLGKRTQFEHTIISDVQDSHKYHGQDYSRPKLYSERHPARANPREGCRFRALTGLKKLSIHEKPVNCPGLYSASVKIIIKIAVFRASLVTNSHKTHGGR